MKKSLLMVSLLAVFGWAQGQGYYFLKSKGTAAPYDLNATGSTSVTAAPATAALSAEQTLPFAWNFYGTAVTKFKASTSGYITFDVTQTADLTANTTLPNASAPKNAIFAFWDDLKLQTVTSGATTFPSDIKTFTYGATPNRVHVIQWRLAQASATSGKDITYFAIRLYEAGDFDIVLNYGFGSFSATTGVNNSDGTQGLNVAGAPNMGFGGKNGSYVAAESDVYKFIYGNVPAYNATVTNIDLQKFYGKNQNIPVKGTLVNIGATAITSFNLNYQIDNGAVVTQNVTGVNIAGYGAGSYDFTHGTPFNSATEGAFNLVVWASDFNGSNADGDTSNDKKSATINVIAKSVERVTLHEIFTSATCGPCVPGNVNQKNIVDGKTAGTYATVKYQQDFPGTGDPYATNETVARRGTFYGINSIPRMEIDGGWDGNANSLTNAIFDQYQQIPTVVELKATYHVSGQSVGIDVNAKSYIDLPSTTKLYIAIMEKITTQNVKSNGETEFEHVVKKMHPNQNGAVMTSLKANNPVDYNVVYTFPGSYKLAPNGQTRIDLTKEHSVENFNNLEVVVWLQNTATKEVYQAANAVSWNTGVAENKTATSVNVYPNPANASTNVNFNLVSEGIVKIEVVNMLGQVVSTQVSKTLAPGEQNIELNTSNIQTGAYLVNIISGDFKVTKPVLVAH
jgi:hypothetical protein